MSDRKKISIVTFCFNEEANVEEFRNQVSRVMAELPQYDYEYIYIDNASTDGTIPILRRMAVADKRVKVILNTRNFGQIRSPYYATMQAHGDAVVALCADLQDPPHLIRDFIRKWEEGYKVVMGVKSQSKELWPIFILRSIYYSLLRKLADVRLVEHFTGFGLYDQKVVETLRQIDDPYPYFRGLIAETGFEAATIKYEQQRRKRGKSKNNFFTLYELAMVGFTTSTKIPLRLATVAGFIVAGVSLLVGLFYLVYKLIYWQNFVVGLAPLVIGISFLGGVQLIFLGIIGEYIGAIYTQVLHRPLVIEKERINFDVQDR